MADINRLKEILNKSKAVMDKAEETHGSIPHRSTYKAFEEIYKGWEIPNLSSYLRNGNFIMSQANWNKKDLIIKMESLAVNGIGFMKMEVL